MISGPWNFFAGTLTKGMQLPTQLFPFLPNFRTMPMLPRTTHCFLERKGNFGMVLFNHQIRIATLKSMNG